MKLTTIIFWFLTYSGFMAGAVLLWCKALKSIKDLTSGNSSENVRNDL